MKSGYKSLYPTLAKVLGRENSDLPEKVQEAWKNLASDQRGKPESAMMDIQKHHSGVLSFCVEHGGDLTHRMCERPEFDDGRGYVKDKAEKVLRTLNRPYGFEKEHEENIINNVNHYKLDLDQYRKTLNDLLTKYANEHRQLVVYNDLQHVARECAVSLGEQKFDRARVYLSSLLRIANNKEEYEKAWAEYTLDANGNPVPYKPY